MASEPAPAWLTSVTRPFSDNPEFHLAARQALAERAADADPDQLNALAERFDITDHSSPRKRTILRWLPVILAFAIALVAGIPSAMKYAGLQNFITSMSGGIQKWPAINPTDRLRDQLTPEQRLFVFGDSSQPTQELAARALWETQPSNPALFADYLGYCDPLPANFLDTARQIDPDNGWFLLIQAGEMAGEAVEKHRRPWSGPKAERPKRADFTIKDEAKFQEALALIEEAVAKPRLESYGTSLLKKRLVILPPEYDFSSRIARLTFAAGTNGGNIFEVLGIAEIISARAFLLGNSKDPDALRDLIASSDSLSRRLNEQDGTLVFQLVKLAIATAIHDHLLEACEKHAMTGEARRLGATLKALRAIRHEGSDWTEEESSGILEHGDMLTALVLPSVGKLGIPPVPVEDLAPGRKVEYALADRVLRWGVVVNLLAAVGIALVLPRLRGAISCRIGRRFAALPDRGDWAWILALGTLAPLAWFMIISYFTPFGCRDWSLRFLRFQPLAVQYSLTLYLVVFANLAVVRWRLDRRASSLHRSTQRPLPALLPVLLPGIAIPVAGTMRFGGNAGLYAGATVIGLCSLWALFRVGRTLFGKAHQVPRRAATAAILAPSLALASLAVLASIPSTYHSERHWIAQDTLMRTSPENHGVSRAEREACELVQARLQAALGAQP